MIDKKEYSDAHKWLKIIQLSMIIYLILLPVMFSGFSLLKHHVTIFISAQLIFPLLTLIMGYFTGAVFSLVNKIWLSKGSGQEIGLHEAGTVYGLDLAGAALGALVSGMLLIPLLGIISLCIILAVTVLGSLTLLLILRS